MSVQGADVEALDELARKIRREANELTRIGSGLSTAIEHVHWVGPDAERFRSDWKGTERAAIRRVSSSLDDLAASVRRQADDQRRASGGSGGGGPTDWGGPGTPPWAYCPLPGVGGPGGPGSLGYPWVTCEFPGGGGWITPIPGLPLPDSMPPDAAGPDLPTGPYPDFPTGPYGPGPNMQWPGLPTIPPPEEYRDGRAWVDVDPSTGTVNVGAEGRAGIGWGDEGAFDTSYVDGEGQWRLGADAEGETGMTLSPGGVDAHARGSAGIGAAADGSLTTEYGRVSGHGEIGAFAEGDAHASVSPTDVRVGAEGEARLGAFGDVSATSGIPGVAETTVDASGGAGVWAQGNADYHSGYDNGTVHRGGSLGFDVGAGIRGEVSQQQSYLGGLIETDVTIGGSAGAVAGAGAGGNVSASWDRVTIDGAALGKWGVGVDLEGSIAFSPSGIADRVFDNPFD